MGFGKSATKALSVVGLAVVGVIACGQTAEFVCGTSTCDSPTQYCFTSRIGNADAGTTSITCQPLPPACTQDRSCGCMADAGLLVSGCGTLDICAVDGGVAVFEHCN